MLEFGSLIWDPQIANGSIQFERVRRDFLSHASFILDVWRSPHDYTLVTKIIGLDFLVDRGRMFGTTFLGGLRSNVIDSPAFLSRINFKVPRDFTRALIPFHITQFRNNCIKNEPIRRLMSISNGNPASLVL